VLFDHGSAEFPVATTVPRETRARAVALVAGLQRWLADRWAWLRPRTVPVAVAGLGMLGILAFSDYLTHVHDSGPAPRAVHIDVAP
jgi:hypothetical protein